MKHTHKQSQSQCASHHSLIVHVCSGFINQQYSVASQQSPRQAYQLSLAHAEICTTLRELSWQTIVKVRHITSQLHLHQIIANTGLYHDTTEWWQQWVDQTGDWVYCDQSGLRCPTNNWIDINHDYDAIKSISFQIPYMCPISEALLAKPHDETVWPGCVRKVNLQLKENNWSATWAIGCLKVHHRQHSRSCWPIRQATGHNLLETKHHSASPCQARSTAQRLDVFRRDQDCIAASHYTAQDPGQATQQRINRTVMSYPCIAANIEGRMYIIQRLLYNCINASNLSTTTSFSTEKSMLPGLSQ